MKKINKKSILLALGILAIFAVGFVALPKNAAAAYGTNFTFGTGNGYSGSAIDQPVEVANNPKPTINSIAPRSSNLGVGTKTITITGSGFIPSSIARVNGVNRNATFIDDSHLLIQVTGGDMNQYRANGGFYVTVFNSAPGGGYSNAAFFTVVDTTASASTNGNSNNGNNNYNNSTGYNGSYFNQNTNINNTDTFTETVNTITTTDNNNNYRSLTSNAIFGSDTFLPSGLIQWIFFAIIILLIVILVRKIFGREQSYHEAPMKHA